MPIATDILLDVATPTAGTPEQRFPDILRLRVKHDAIVLNLLDSS